MCVDVDVTVELLVQSDVELGLVHVGSEGSEDCTGT